MWQSFNANPVHNRVGDCVVRTLSKALGQDWDTTFIDLFVKGFEMCDMPNANAVWGAYLKEKGFKRYAISEECADCYTVEDFCREHPKGTYILAISGHVVPVIDGTYFDTWNSGDEIPVYYWKREEK